MGDKSAPTSIALAGVPNVGKTTIFNSLTGLNQKIGNYPGVTVDKKTGVFKRDGRSLNIIDLPGTYNIFPRSEDERVVFRVLSGLEKKTNVDAVLAVVDMSNLERGLFLITQLIDLGYPLAVVLNMADQADRQQISLNKNMLERLLGVPVFISSADKGEGIEEIKSAMMRGEFKVGRTVIDHTDLENEELLLKVAGLTNQPNAYRALQVLKFRTEETEIEHRERLDELAQEFSFDSENAQSIETELRYKKVDEIISKCVKKPIKPIPEISRKLDAIFLHKFWGAFIFGAIMFLLFQSIFTWAEAPMDWIDNGFAFLGHWVKNGLPAGVLTDLLTEGIIPGLGGIVIFVPQIALLFTFLAILEGTGYMARAVFITDRLMRPFGLNGRSVVPLISGFACAIPGIMAARTISNTKDRLITIFVTPFMSCSARLPVYIILIGLLFPDSDGGFFDPRGLALFFLYILGIAAALASAFVMKLFMKSYRNGGLVLELPRYQYPHLKTVVLTAFEKSKTFVFEAGKIILAISIVLWVLASYGPTKQMAEARNAVPEPSEQMGITQDDYDQALASAELEASYAGIIGKWIEPVIKPLGYDWKIGIALVCSFAAREVFVSTMATLYSIGDSDEDIESLQDLLKGEKKPDGTPVFTLAMVWSLLIFYAFAMQCMSTVAVVYRETKSIKWPLIQTVYMTLLAYVSAFLTFHFLS